MNMKIWKKTNLTERFFIIETCFSLIQFFLLIYFFMKLIESVLWICIGLYSFSLVSVLPDYFSLNPGNILAFFSDFFIISLIIYLWPLIYGNLLFLCLVRIAKIERSRKGSYLVEIRFYPRQKRGFLGKIKKFDDYGYLEVRGESIHFSGTVLEFCIPFDQISEIYTKNPGFQGLWVSGKKLILESKQNDFFNSLQFIERESRNLLISRQTSKSLSEHITNMMTLNKQRS